MKKQTAVEWLIEQYENGIMFRDDELKIHEQAKQMEKEQMLEVSKAGCFSTFEFEQYYNKTYTNEK